MVKYFDWQKESRWMSFCPEVREEYRDLLQSVTHIDNTARVQTVTRDQNWFLYDLLTELDKKCGTGIVINTSFNVAGKPILNTYKEAFEVFDKTEMSALLLDDYLFTKP
jgi:carbamoyltransferase